MNKKEDSNKEVSALKTKVTEMETSRKKLGQQAERYTAELNEALERYKDLQKQAALDPDKLNQAQLVLRPDKEKTAVARVRAAYGDKYRLQMMNDSKRRVSQMLGEKNERPSMLKRLEEEEQRIKETFQLHEKTKKEYER